VKPDSSEWDRNGGEIIPVQEAASSASLDIRSYHCDAVTAAPTTCCSPGGRLRAALKRMLQGMAVAPSQGSKEARAQCERLSLHNAADRISWHYIESEGTNGG
jgi:hypothetical protein